MVKKLQDLRFTDNFMFGAVMLDEESCKKLLEIVLEIPIDHVEVEREKSMVYHPEYHGVRLDVYAKDENGTRYNVELQMSQTPIEKRSRYYQGQMDTDILDVGEGYEKLPDSYVIFICGYDPFDTGLYRYTLSNRCHELPQLEYNDGRKIVILSTEGENEDEIPKELHEFLTFVKNEKLNRTVTYEDPYVRQLQERINSIKRNREMGVKYMAFADIVNRERQEGREEERNQNIESYVMDAREDGMPEAKIIEKVIKIFHLTEAEVQAYLLANKED